MQQLERLSGWSWNRNSDRLQRTLALLRRYVKREGHAHVPYSHVEAGRKLGQWVSYRRAVYASGDMSEDAVAAFEALPGWSWRLR